jgi:hypothetical protein
MTCSSNAKEQTIISKIEFDIGARKKKFGTDYLTLEEKNASPEELQACLDAAKKDVSLLKSKIHDKEEAIGKNKEQLQRSIDARKPGSPSAASAPAVVVTASTPAVAASPAPMQPPAADFPAPTPAPAPAAAESPAPAAALEPAPAATTETTN